MILYLKTKKFCATAEFAEGIVTVLAGSTLKKKVSTKVNKNGIAIRMRNNEEYVNKDLTVIKDCTFKSLSTAAQFVLGTYVNGRERWIVESGESIKEYMDKKNK